MTKNRANTHPLENAGYSALPPRKPQKASLSSFSATSIITRPPAFSRWTDRGLERERESEFERERGREREREREIEREREEREEKWI